MINTRQYRSPEVLLGHKWTTQSDVWSLGCVIAESFLGDLLFQTHEDHEHLALIEKIIGQFSQEFLSRTPEEVRIELLTDSVGRMNPARVLVAFPVDPVSESSVRKVKNAASLEAQFKAYPDFRKLLRKMLTIVPESRVTAKEAMREAFFKGYARD